MSETATTTNPIPAELLAAINGELSAALDAAEANFQSAGDAEAYSIDVKAAINAHNSAHAAAWHAAEAAALAAKAA